jgi:DNA-binding winged helix-turn-helix (wHTH) protein
VTCLVCAAELSARRATCDGCAERLGNPRGLCPEHLLWIGDEPELGAAALIDQWGRPHYLRDVTVIGREPEEGICVLESSVSRRHASITKADGCWRVQDLDSRNGTTVGADEVAAEPVRIDSGHKLVVGDVAFYFVAHERLLAGVDVTVGGTEPTRKLIGEQLEEVPMRLAAPTEQGGGSVELSGACIHLSPIQYELVRLLADRMLLDIASAHSVRGFVSSASLLSTLPWSASYPTDNNLKQLVRRVRRAFAAEGVAELIESRQGVGYRLQSIPRILSK